MNMDNARILVIGAGVNGSVCAVGLHNAGIDVTVLARGKRYEELRNEGIIIENPLKHKRSVAKVPVIISLEPEDVYDYVLVIIRKNQIADLLPVLARNRSPNIVFMSNNLSGADDYIGVIDKERIMLGFVFGAGKREGDVVYAISGVGGALGAIFGGVPFGEIDGAITPRLTRLVGIFCRAGLDAKASSRVSDYLATHAAFITLMVILGNKHGGDQEAIARSTSDLGLLVDALREMLDVLLAFGYRITPSGFKAIKMIPRFILVAVFHSLFTSDKWDLIAVDMTMPRAPIEIL